MFGIAPPARPLCVADCACSSAGGPQERPRHPQCSGLPPGRELVEHLAFPLKHRQKVADRTSKLGHGCRGREPRMRAMFTKKRIIGVLTSAVLLAAMISAPAHAVNLTI